MCGGLAKKQLDLKFRITGVGKWGWLDCEWKEKNGERGARGRRRGEIPGNFEMLESNVKERDRQKNRPRWLV